MKPTILITGASSGIGQATALYFAERGWKVIATMRNVADGVAFDAIENIIVAPLDISSNESILDTLALIFEQTSQIDVLLNNAGYAEYGIFEAISESAMRNQFEVNVFGTMNMIRAILPYLRRQEAGCIINVTSGSGRFGVPLMSLYNASKFALEGFSESLAYELESQNIIVKIVEPGSTSSNFHHRLERRAIKHTIPPNYRLYVNQLNEKMSQIRSNSSNNSSTPLQIAATIYEAATDGCSKLRYVSGNDITPILDLRASKSDEEFISFMRKMFNVNQQ